MGLKGRVLYKIAVLLLVKFNFKPEHITLKYGNIRIEGIDADMKPLGFQMVKNLFASCHPFFACVLD